MADVNKLTVAGAVSLVGGVLTIYMFVSGNMTLQDVFGTSKNEPTGGAVAGEAPPPTLPADDEPPRPPDTTPGTQPPGPRVDKSGDGRWYIRLAVDKTLEGTSAKDGGALYEASRAVRLFGHHRVAIFKFNGNWATMVGPYSTEDAMGAAKPETAQAWGRRVVGNDMGNSMWCSSRFVTRQSPVPRRFAGPIYDCE